MAKDGLVFGFRTEDLALDGDGRVRILDPQVARAVAAALRARPDDDNDDDEDGRLAANNCHGGNCAAGCGSGPVMKEEKR
ncbi:hypothetical protein [Streptomyces sp. SS]|uniref:hypothetical protein n=1 Tax=Streptomyces sp. SS TaxID=260742 RepID=UPI0002EE2DD4|nr:hypothetical protein [Streptomyces sp. SS]